MQVGVLGPLLVRVDEHELPLRGQRLRDVLVVLLQRRGRPVPAEVVLELVWGEAARELGTSVVHTVVARLRRRLGPDAITSDGFGYLVDRGVSTDEDTFTDLLARARSCLDRDDHSGARSNYRAALGTWRGPEAFGDVAAPLVEADRSRLAELRAVAAEEFAAALLEQSAGGGLDEARALTAELIATLPLRERPYQLGMLAAYRGHRQAEALAIYQALRRRLRDDLGIEPTPTSAQLNSKILHQDPLLEVSAAVIPVRAAAGSLRPAGLPAPVTPLIGRSAEFGQLQEALSGGRRLITLVGPGGVGKTRLLIELGARRQEMKGVVYAEMSGLIAVGTDELAGVIAGQGGLDPRRPPAESLVASFAEGNWLLLIDEAEWVVDPLGPLLTSILAGCAGVQIVLITRIPMDIAGECLIAVEPLGVPDEGGDITTMLASPAVQFLSERLTDRAVAVGQDRASVELLASIARQLDGLPLALELAAGQATGRSLTEIAGLVESMLDLPAAHRSSGERHRTLRGTLTWSMSRLDIRQQTVIRRLSVFAGRFTLADAVTICGPIEGVAGIVRCLAMQSLVQVERTSASRLRFRLLRAVRELAAEDFAAEDLAATQARHRRWFAGLSRADGVDLVDSVQANVDECVEALRTALLSRDAGTLAELTVTMAEYWRRTGAQVVGIRWICRVLNADILGATDRARLQAHRAALALHHFPDLVLPDAETALSVLATNPDEPLVVLAAIVRSVELLSRGAWAQAVEQVDTAVQYARRRVDDDLIRAISVQANIHAVIADVAGADTAVAEVVSLIDEMTPSATRIVAHTNIGLAMLNLDRPAAARQLLDVVCPDVDKLTGRRPPEFYLLCSGWAELGCGEAATAVRRFFASVPPNAPGIADRQSAETYLGVGCALAELSHPSATETLAAALVLAERVQLTIPPALDRVVIKSRQRIGSSASTDMAGVPTDLLLERLQQLLAEAAAGLDAVPLTAAIS